MSIFDDPKVREAKDRLVAAAPPLSAEQRTRLAAILSAARSRSAA